MNSTVKDTLMNAGKKTTQQVINSNSKEIVHAIFSTEAGRQAGTAVVNVMRGAAKPIYGGAARNVATSSLRSATKIATKANYAVAAASAAADIIPDAIALKNGHISKREFAERSAVNVSSAGGAVAGAAQGAAWGSAFGPVGTVAGAVIGGLVGEQGCKAIGRGLISIFK